MMDEERRRRLEEDDRAILWHPYTQMAEYVKDEPLIIEEGEGVYLKDIYGRKFLDGVSSLWVNLHGHRRREIDGALRRQLDKVAHSTLLGISNVPAIELARRLIEIAPSGLRRVFYSDNGSTAVEVALKMAYQFWQQGPVESRGRRRFITFKNAYHGDTLGAVGVGGIPLFHDLFRPLTFEPLFAESPYCYRCPLNLSYPRCEVACLESLEEILRVHGDEVAALVIEPKVQAAAGMIVQPPGFLRRIRELCDRYGVLTIFDEVAVGFGRTGKMFACQQEDVSPDILCLGKGITGGYLPLAATLTSEEIFQGFLGDYSSFRTFFHGHTYTGNPLACAAALANLDVFERDGTLEAIQGKIKFLERGLERFYELSHVGDVRQCGLMVGIELVRDRESKEPYPPEEKVGLMVTLEARRRGLIFRPLGNVMVLMPPLVASEGELEGMMEILYESIKAVADD